MWIPVAAVAFLAHTSFANRGELIRGRSEICSDPEQGKTNGSDRIQIRNPEEEY